MNIDNSNKSTAGSLANASLQDLLTYLKEENLIREFTPRKFGYPEMQQDQFKCDYLITLADDSKWIVFSAKSLTTDRLKTKQWDSENIKIIDTDIERAYVVCPDSLVNNPKAADFYRYRGYIRAGLYHTYVDDLLLQSEFVSLVEDWVLGQALGGSKAAKKGLHFEDLVTKVFENRQNLDRWKGDYLSPGFHYQLFEAVMKKLDLNPSDVISLEANNNIPSLPQYQYKDGTVKKGGRAKTDVVLFVNLSNGRTGQYTFSCKSTTKKDISVGQFIPKHMIELLGIDEPDMEQLLAEYVSSGGPTKMPADRAELLELRMSKYVDSFNRWVLHGSSKEGSTKLQRADFMLIRYQKKESEEFYIETVDECIENQYRINKGNFGTAFSWTVTSANKNKDGIKSDVYPNMRIYVKE